MDSSARSGALHPSLCVLLIGLVFLAAPADAKPEMDYSSMSLEELMNVRVTSVSKKAESLQGSAAAIYVLSADDIRRSGATTIPEALRLVPGMQVAQNNASSWSIGSRGFNTGLSNKLLVLVDGRSVYSQLYSGVFWDSQDILLDDLDRIEVIRGPGGTLWGANAVNGVINIITKSATETTGTLAFAGAGGETRGLGYVRHGAPLGENVHFRAHAKYRDFDQSFQPIDRPDDWKMGRVQMRLDGKKERDQWSLIGDYYDGEVMARSTLPSLDPPYGELVENPVQRRGADLVAHWMRQLDGDADLSFQAFYDYLDNDYNIMTERRSTFDLEAKHRMRVHARHELNYGAGYRFSTDDLGSSAALINDPAQRGVHLFSAFAQDQITLLPEKLDFTLGSKIEHNDFTGVEVQPSARLRWTPRATHTVWAAVSRAVRTPTRLEDDANFVFVSPPGTLHPTLPTQYEGFSSHDFEAENVQAYELGYRVAPTKKLTADGALFYNRYHKLATYEVGAPFQRSTPTPHQVLPLFVDNLREAESYGAELALWFQAHEKLRFHGAYSFLRMYHWLLEGSGDSSSVGEANRSPRHQAFLRSSVDLPHDFQFDAVFRYVDIVWDYDIPSYAELDLRLGWNPAEFVRVSVTGRNLLHDHHLEGVESSANEVEREVIAGVGVHF